MSVKLQKSVRRPLRGWLLAKKDRKFNVLPFIEIKEADEHNTSHFYFRWLFLTFWVLDTPNLAVEIACSDHWGFGVIGLLPYLRWAITIPIPVNPDKWYAFSRKLHRGG